MGIIWNKKEYIWMQTYQQLKAYIDKHERYMLPDDLQNSFGSSLKSWIIYNRQLYKRGKLTEEKMKLLDEIFIFEIGFFDPAHIPAYCREVVYEFGDQTDSPTNQIETIQAAEEEYQSPHDREWMENFHKLEAYLQQYGNAPLPKDLPSAYGQNMYLWIVRNRKWYKNGDMTEDRAKLLESIDILHIRFYDPSKKNKPQVQKVLKDHTVKGNQRKIKEQQWYENIEICRQNIAEHGLILPYDLQTVQGGSLRNWVNLNRYKYNKGTLKPERASALESIQILEIQFRKPAGHRKNHTSKSHANLTSEQRRKKQITFLVNAEENNIIRQKAAANGYTSVAEYIRMILLEK